MSSESNDQLWDRSIETLKQLLLQEEEANNPSEEDKYTHSAKLYILYRLILNDMNKVFDSCVQAQKRIDMKTTIEQIICRVIRLRGHLQKLTPTTQDDLSNALTELRISPSQIEAFTPLLLKEDNESVTARISKMETTPSISLSLEGALDAKGTAALPDNDDDQDAPTSTSQPDEPEIESDSEKENIVNNMSDDKLAATKIQSLYRGSFARKRVSSARQQLDNFIGMSNSNNKEETDQLDAYIAKMRQQKAQEQSQCLQSYEAEIDRLRSTVLEEEGFSMQMELREERIRWITEQTVAKHTLPDSLDDFYREEANRARLAHDATMTTKEELKPLSECIKIYEQRWKDRVVGPDRITSQAVDSEMAKDLIVRSEVKAHLIPSIDKKLLANLQKIKATQEGDKKKPKKKEKPAKGKKAGKKKGGKKEKPLPGEKLPEVKDMQVQEMLECLIQNGFIYEYDNDKVISNFISPFEAAGNSPTAWELRTAVMDLCILSIGSKRIKACIPDESIRSILFYGPEGTGKTLMTEIIASEVGALVIHLSSTSIGNAFEDGNDATKLIHMIFTVAKEESLSPVIIYLDDCEEFFLGKSKKKGANSDAINTSMKRFQKDLLIYKNQYLTKKDRVLVIGCSNKPEAGDMKLMKWKGPGGKPDKQGFFEHALCFPLPSHTSRSMILKEAIRRKVDSQCQVDFDLLAHMTSGYSHGQIVELVNEVLSHDRKRHLASTPISEHDFAPKLLPKEPFDQSFVEFRRQWNGSKKSSK